jgi:hypothetical protein
MRDRHTAPLAALGLLLLGGYAYSQGYQPNFIRNFVGPISIVGNVTSTGTGTFTGNLTTSGNLGVPTSGKVLFDNPTGTVYATYGGAGVVQFGNSAANAIAFSGETNSGNATIRGALRNDLSGSSCTPAGAVCVDDANGFAVANGSGTTNATISATGYIASTTPHTLTSLELNVAAAAATYGGHALPAKAFTVTGVTGYVSGVSGAGAGNTTWRISDGTNNCDCNFPCAGGAGVGSNATGTLRCTPSGTCAFAASSALSISVQTAGCATTQPTIQNLDIEGNWQ